MKFLVASDIHGSSFYCRQLAEAIDRESPDRILLLGDILYHGPRNDLPRDYAPKEVIAILSPFADRLVSVRGNCDTEVDQMVLPFPILSESAYVQCGDSLILASHGHIYNPDKLPPMGGATVLLCGHTHVPACVEHDGFVYMNCGSVSIPKENSPHSYMLLDDGTAVWCELETGKEYNRYKL